MLDFTKLWDKTYLLGPNPVELSRSDLIFFWAALAFTALGIAAKVFAWRAEIASPQKYFMNRLYHLFLTMGVLVLLWAGLRFENIPWLSTHIVILGLILIWFVWLVFIAKYFFREFPRQKKIWDEERIKRKYLP